MELQAIRVQENRSAKPGRRSFPSRFSLRTSNACIQAPRLNASEPRLQAAGILAASLSARPRSPSPAQHQGNTARGMGSGPISTLRARTVGRSSVAGELGTWASGSAQQSGRWQASRHGLVCKWLIHWVSSPSTDRTSDHARPVASHHSQAEAIRRTPPGAGWRLHPILLLGERSHTP